MMSRDTTGSPPRGFGRRAMLAGAGTAISGALAGCSGVFAADDNQINVAGSSTVFPVTEAVASAYSEEHPTVNISLSQTGTGGGFANFFCVGRTDINNASRDIADVEIEQCGDNGITALELPIATDALTVVVNEDSPVDCLTVDQLREIWRADGVDRWSEVDPDWPDESIERYGAATTSGTFDYFTEAILEPVDAHHVSDYHATERDRTIVQGVQGSAAAIGYFGFSYYSENPGSVDAVEIDDGNGCVAPSLETAMAATSDSDDEDAYTPLSRSLYIYVARESLVDPAVQDFVRFYIDRAATDLVSDVGYVPISEGQRDQNLEKLETAIEEVTA